MKYEFNATWFVTKVLANRELVLANARIAIERSQDAAVLWELAAADGNLGADWLDNESRMFANPCAACDGWGSSSDASSGDGEAWCIHCRGVGYSIQSRPSSIALAALLSATPNVAETAEKLAVEIVRRLDSWGAPKPSKFIWSIASPSNWRRGQTAGISSDAIDYFSSGSDELRPVPASYQAVSVAIGAGVVPIEVANQPTVLAKQVQELFKGSIFEYLPVSSDIESDGVWMVAAEYGLPLPRIRQSTLKTGFSVFANNSNPMRPLVDLWETGCTIDTVSNNHITIVMFSDVA